MNLQCTLCPRLCLLAPGQCGYCRVRINLDAKVRALTFARPVALHLDPMEKKPLYHFLPATTILSLATVGCNLHCINCQNWQISQANPWDSEAYHLEPEALVALTIERQAPSIAYTYTEPLVFYEYTLACARAARAQGIYNVLVSAAYINPEPLAQLLPWIDAANIDLKAMDDTFYQRICDATLWPVLDALIAIKAAGVWLEVTNLLIPTLNDSNPAIAELCRWVVTNLGPDTPIHFSAFTPRYKLQNLPRTPAATLLRARDIARDAGIHHVYLGNLLLEEANHTYCPHDNTLLIQRRGFQILANHLDQGRCPTCLTPCPGKWS